MTGEQLLQFYSHHSDYGHCQVRNSKMMIPSWRNPVQVIQRIANTKPQCQDTTVVMNQDNLVWLSYHAMAPSVVSIHGVKQPQSWLPMKFHTNDIDLNSLHSMWLEGQSIILRELHLDSHHGCNKIFEMNWFLRFFINIFTDKMINNNKNANFSLLVCAFWVMGKRENWLNLPYYPPKPNR